MEIQRKNFVGIKALSEAGEGTAVIATLNVIDKDGDVTLPGAFGEQPAKMIPAHDWGHVPIGKAMIREEGNNVLADFKLNLDIQAGRDWHSSLKNDMEEGPPLQEWSYGFAIQDSGEGEFEGQQVRFLKSLKVHEISPVIVGAGVDTRTVAVKNAPDSMRFTDQIKGALEGVDAVLERCKEIKSVREKVGRGLSPDRYAELSELNDSLCKLAGIKNLLDNLLTRGEEDEQIAGLLLAEFTKTTTDIEGVLKK